MPMIETFPIESAEYILLPKQSAWASHSLAHSVAHNNGLAHIQALFSPEHLNANSLVTNTALGRGVVYFFEAMEEKCVLRHYYRGGLVAKISNDRFIFHGIENSRPYKELNLLCTLSAAGLNVPKPIAAKLKRIGLTYTADIITGTIENAEELHTRLVRETLAHDDWRKVGSTLRKMHDLQACHYDINVKNILIQKCSDTLHVHLLDFDGCKIRNGNGWKVANLDRFKRSLEKQKARISPYHFDADCWQSLIAGYQS